MPTGLKGIYKDCMKEAGVVGESVDIGVNKMLDALVSGGALVKTTGRGRLIT